MTPDDVDLGRSGVSPDACGCPSCAAADAMTAAFVRAERAAPVEAAGEGVVTALMVLHRYAIGSADGAGAQARVAARLLWDLMRVAADRGLPLVEDAGEPPPGCGAGQPRVLQ